MITVTKQEHIEMVASAEATLVAKALSINEQLKRGQDIQKSSIPLAVAYNNLLALRHYKTGDFDPAEYLNVQTPADVANNFSNVNTIETFK